MMFTDGVIRIVECCGQRVVENSDRFIKRNPMLFDVALSFLVIPFEPHWIILAYSEF